MNNSKKEQSGGKMGKVLAASVLAAGAAAAGYYFYGSKDAKQHRKQAAKWATVVKNEAMSQLKKASKIDKAAVVAAVSGAVKNAQKMTGIDKKELEKLSKELKSHWNIMAEEAGKTVKSGLKQAKKVVKKVAKKVSK